jgi:polyhydroxyalkanoate synthesis regulator phasin
MAEPENHTLRLLQEIRREGQNLRQDIDRLGSKVDQGFGDLKERIASLTQVLAGEMVTRRHTDAKVEERLGALERRVSELEEHS